MAEKPECRKCGKPHWRFVRCEDADELNQQEARSEQAREQAKVVPIFTSDRPWGDQLHSLTTSGSNVFWLNRKDNDDGPEAA